MTEYLAEKISRRLLRGGFELSMNHRFSIVTVYLSLISLLIFPNIGLADPQDVYYEVQRVVDGFNKIDYFVKRRS